MHVQKFKRFRLHIIRHAKTKSTILETGGGGRRSEVGGRRSDVRSRGSGVRGQGSVGGELGDDWDGWRSEVRGQMSDVGCQKSEVSGQMLEWGVGRTDRKPPCLRGVV